MRWRYYPYTSWVSAGRAYTAATVGADLVNVTSTSNSDTCDFKSTLAGGVVAEHCGTGGNNGKTGVQFCVNSTDCTINTAYQQSSAAGNPGNFTNAFHVLYWDPLGFNGKPCFVLYGHSFLAAGTFIPSSRILSISTVVNGTTTVTGVDGLMSPNGNTQLQFNTTNEAQITDGSTNMNLTETFPGQFAMNGVINGASSSLNVNGTLASVTSIAGSSTPGNSGIGYNAGSDQDCVAEAGFIDNVDFAPNEATLHTQQSAFWGSP